jgi:hypothetical protein
MSGFSFVELLRFALPIAVAGAVIINSSLSQQPTTERKHYEHKYIAFLCPITGYPCRWSSNQSSPEDIHQQTK